MQTWQRRGHGMGRAQAKGYFNHESRAKGTPKEGAPCACTLMATAPHQHGEKKKELAAGQTLIAQYIKYSTVKPLVSFEYDNAQQQTVAHIIIKIHVNKEISRYWSGLPNKNNSNGRLPYSHGLLLLQRRQYSVTCMCIFPPHSKIVASVLGWGTAEVTLCARSYTSLAQSTETAGGHTIRRRDTAGVSNLHKGD